MIYTMPKMHHEIEIDAPPAKVYDAITEQEGLRGWWTIDSVAKPIVDNVAVFGFRNRETLFRMRVDKLIPSKLVEWKCVGGPKEWKGTRLTWEISKTKGGSNLHFIHSKWGSTDGDFAMCNSTWGNLMYRLKSFAESGQSNPLFK